MAIVTVDLGRLCDETCPAPQPGLPPPDSPLAASFPQLSARFVEGSAVSKRHIVVGLGELLWDLLPAGRQLGGAPANFAYITSLLGDEGIPASRLGEDALGAEAIRRLGELALPTEFIQKDTDHPTGTVQVEVDGPGQPRFEISGSVAWDFLDWTPQWQTLAHRADA